LYAGIASVLFRRFPHCALSYIGEPSHLEHVSRQLGSAERESIEFIPITLTSNRDRLAKVYFSLRLRYFVARMIQRNSGAYILLLSTTGPEFSFLTALAKPNGPAPVYVDALLHGPNRGNFAWRSRNPLLRWTDLVAAIDRSKRKRSRLLALDWHTIPEWEALTPALTGRVGPLDIALIPPQQSATAERRPRGSPLRFGFLGQATQAKGFPTFVQCAEEATRLVGEQAEFHLIGRLSAELSGCCTGPVRLHTDRPQQRYTPANQMSRKRYVALIDDMDYICLPYSGEYYRSGASGVFFDAVNLLKPIIAKRMPFVDAAFAEFGPMGLLCDSDEEMRRMILALVAGDLIVDYDAFRANMQQCRAYHSPEAVGNRFSAWLRADRPALYAALILDSADVDQLASQRT
jgi:hypothetical protein